MREVADVLFLVACVCRVTDCLLYDQIGARWRDWGSKRLGYLATCPRCLSVWVAVVCVAVWAVCPVLNWPLGLSWIYLKLKRELN